MLQPLPTELFFEIARYLDHADLKAARLSCKALAVVTAPFLFRRLVIVFRSHSFLWDEEASFRRRHSFLKALAERRTHLGRHVKSLRIAEPFDAYRPPKTITNLPQRALKLLTPKRYKKRDFSECIVKLLGRALPYLESLYELDWGSSRQGVFETTLPPKRLEHAIQLLKVLSAMPSIRELSISIHLNGSASTSSTFSASKI
ncbi:hypothetical protein CPB85DRAFT_836545 [Mucidula mucida]|nr:hypothetical protein CPB85DRAFT_836545 [Mucidula mucida]